MFTTSDLMTYVVNYKKHVTRALRSECGLSLMQYRELSYLSDHIGGIGPTQLASILSTSPASITLTSDDLVKRKLVRRGGTESRQWLSIEKAGIDLALDADLVLSQTHEEYFAVLTPQQKAVVDTGSMITNKNSAEGNRMRDGHFFSAFETLHAFLTVETFLTNSAQTEGLSLNGFRMLFELDGRGGASKLGQLGNVLLLPPATVAHAAGQLEERGLVTRSTSSDDRRSRMAAMTDEGRAVFSRALDRVESVFTTDIRSSGAAERDSYKDAAALVVSALRKKR